LLISNLLRLLLVTLNHLMQHTDIVEEERGMVAKDVPWRIFKDRRHNVIGGYIALLTNILNDRLQYVHLF